MTSLIEADKTSGRQTSRLFFVEENHNVNYSSKGLLLHNTK